MSRTYRNTDTYRKGKKMKPYVADKDLGELKFKPNICYGNPHGDGDSGMHTGISKLGKLVAKNANRSLKKGARQQIKNELKQYI